MTLSIYLSIPPKIKSLTLGKFHHHYHLANLQYFAKANNDYICFYTITFQRVKEIKNTPAEAGSGLDWKSAELFDFAKLSLFCL